MRKENKYLGRTRAEWEKLWDKADETPGEYAGGIAKGSISEILGQINALEDLSKRPMVQLRLFSDLMLASSETRNRGIKIKMKGRRRLERGGQGYKAG